jgi:UDP-N-acetylglucosamine:LPS N-acetylglucosamine transferase
LRLSRELGEIERIWVTFDTADARSLLRGEQVIYAHHPTNRSVSNLIRNLFLAWSVLRRSGASVVISTGAGVGVPFCWVGRVLGSRVIFVESLTRVDSPSLSGRLAMPFAHRYFAQWPALAQRYRKAEYVGSLE